VRREQPSAVEPPPVQPNGRGTRGARRRTFALRGLSALWRIGADSGSDAAEVTRRWLRPEATRAQVKRVWFRAHLPTLFVGLLGLVATLGAVLLTQHWAENAEAKRPLGVTGASRVPPPWRRHDGALLLGLQIPARRHPAGTGSRRPGTPRMASRADAMDDGE
jgi:hypothetical protein